MADGLYKRGKIYHYDFEFDRVRYQGSCRTASKEQAKKVYDEIRKDLVNRRYGIKSPQTVKWMYDRWVEEVAPTMGTDHVRNVDIFMRLHILPAIGNTLMTRCDTEVIRKVVTSFAQSHKPSSTNKLITVINLVFNFAIKDKYLGSMPYEIDWIPEPQRVRPHVKVPDAKGFLDFIRRTHRNPQMWIMVAFGLFMGLREKEILRAEWDNLDLERMTYTVPGESINANKSKNRRTRTIDLPSFLVEPLRTLPRVLGSPYIFPRSNRDSDGKLGGPHPRTYLTYALKGTDRATKLVRKDGKYVRVPGEVVHLPGLCEKFGLPRMGAHRLRASFATMNAAAGMTMEDIRIAGGWATLEQVQTYLEENREQRTESARKLERLAGFVETVTKSPTIIAQEA